MILIRTAKTSELKELHCVKRPFKKKEEKNRKKRREQNQTGDPYGARTFGAASNSIKNPLRGEKKNIHCSHTAVQSHWTLETVTLRQTWDDNSGCHSHLRLSIFNMGHITDGVMLSSSHLYRTFYPSCLGFVYIFKYIFGFSVVFKITFISHFLKHPNYGMTFLAEQSET